MGTTPEDILKGSNRSKVVHYGVGEHSRVIHRDLKSANILLDANPEANICDFGLSRLSPRNQQDTVIRTRPSVSSGMMAYKVRPLEDQGLFLIDIVRSYYDDRGLFDRLDKLKDPTIEDENGLRSFHKINEIAHECINLDLRKRPTMDKIIKAITEALNFQTSPKESTQWQKDFWEELLSPDYQEIIVRAVPPLDIRSKKPLYFRLSDSRIFLDGGYLVSVGLYTKNVRWQWPSMAK
ncbi:unnamed protein product [Lactuca saligna]|uniref:Protein kinase domain-containing protein n=1 Tax=Lactuca saligna TaxID=75948 RepID=A0AA35YD83_LACSI|nr:unnamed protein product [Lactuca saligna]